MFVQRNQSFHTFEDEHSGHFGCDSFDGMRELSGFAFGLFLVRLARATIGGYRFRQFSTKTLEA